MLPQLTAGGLYAALYRRPDGKYHWALILADGPATGFKMHATNIPDPTSWHYVHEQFDVSTEWKPLTILARIGTVPAAISSDTVDGLLHDILMETPQCDAPQRFTCRIWFREAIRVMNVHAGIVHCRSVNALERELVELADSNANLVALGNPWKLHEDVDASY